MTEAPYLSLLVVAHMRGQRALVREAHAALGARERFETDVHARVRNQRGLVRELLAAVCGQGGVSEGGESWEHAEKGRESCAE